MTTFEKLKKIISEQLYVDESKITMDSDIVEDFEADSIEMLSNTSTQISNIPNIHCPR